MSDQNDDQEQRRLRKMNALLSNLPAEQRELLAERISSSAPGLIKSKTTSKPGSSDGAIDTPMRRARSLARSILKRERTARQQKGRWGPPNSSDDLTQASQTASIAIKDHEEDSDDEYSTLTPPLPLSALLDLDAPCLLKAYLDSELEDWLKALKIADPEIKEHLLYTLPVRYASELEEALRSLGPMKLSDAQAAAHYVMKRVQKLSNRGEIKLDR